jgi:hypothetical protein
LKNSLAKTMLEIREKRSECRMQNVGYSRKIDVLLPVITSNGAFRGCKKLHSIIIISSPIHISKVAYFFGWLMTLFLKWTRKQCKSVNNIQQHCYVFPKNFYPGGIRTGVFSFWGECDVQCATPRGQLEKNMSFSTYRVPTVWEKSMYESFNTYVAATSCLFFTFH